MPRPDRSAALQEKLARRRDDDDARQRAREWKGSGSTGTPTREIGHDRAHGAQTPPLFYPSACPASLLRRPSRSLAGSPLPYSLSLSLSDAAFPKD